MSEQNEIPWQEGQTPSLAKNEQQDSGLAGQDLSDIKKIMINMDEFYSIKGGAIVAIANILKDEIPARFFQTILKVENLLSTVTPLGKTK